MCIVNVNPKKERAGYVAGPCKSTLDHVISPALNTLVAIFSSSTLVKLSVIKLKTTIETVRCHRRIEDGGTDKRRGPVSVRTQNCRHVRQILVKHGSQITDVIKLWVSAGQYAGVRGGCHGFLCVSVGKHHCLHSERVEVGRKFTRRAKKTHAVSTGGVERNQNYVGPGRRLCSVSNSC